MLFPQAMMPAVDMKSGKVLLEDRAGMALSPNGHGGSLKALWAGGAIADMKKRGIEQISYTQVDNPIVKVIDPQFIGLHALDGCEMSSKMLPKREPLEKLGNFCLVDGRMTVIEYSNLPDNLAHEKAPNGDLRFRAGSIAIHVIRVDFVESLNTRPGGFALPFNRAEKKVPYLCPDSGSPVKPEKPNAVKLETFVFDALPMCERSIIYETDRVDEFAPIKNADASPIESSVDSPYTSMLGQTERAARWLEAAGVKVARRGDGKVDAVIEISQLTAIEAGDLKGLDLPKEVPAGSHLLL
jgi:UDP-N-acetylglucosamine/UDP-N-acetylgalactosamine diphosphorylase